MIGDEYNKISESEREKLEKLVKDDKKRYEWEFAKWEKKYGEDLEKIKKL